VRDCVGPVTVLVADLLPYCTCSVILCLADSQLRQAQADHDAAERKLAELKAEKERVSRQVCQMCTALTTAACGTCCAGSVHR
jgi:hypothetical protein